MSITVNMTIVWLVLLVVFLLVEFATTALTSIWFAFGSLVAIFFAAFGLPIYAQCFAFLLVSFLVLFLVRPSAVRYFNKNRVRTNIDAMTGRQAVVISEINNAEEIGQVRIDGMEWTARSTINEKHLAVGTVVVIRAVDGVKLIVEAAEQQ